MKIPFLGRGNSQPKFEPTAEEMLVINACSQLEVPWTDVSARIDEAKISASRRDSVEHSIRAGRMDSVLSGSKERQA